MITLALFISVGFGRIFIASYGDAFVFFEDYVRGVFGSDFELCRFERTSPGASVCQFELLDSRVGVLFLQKIPLDFNASHLDTRKGKLAVLVTEQLTVEYYRNELAQQCNKYPNLAVVNYSPANEAIISREGLCAGHQVQTLSFIPCGGQMPNYLPLRREQKVFDVAFIGFGSPRRELILNELKQRFIVNHMTNVWKAQRNLDFSRSRIVLNVHFSIDFNIFETMRCTEAVLSGSLVVSETSEPCQLNPIEQLVHFAPYDQLVETVANILNNYDMLYAKHIHQLRQLDQLPTVPCVGEL